MGSSAKGHSTAKKRKLENKTGFENQIDQLVYKLYYLTPEEIHIDGDSMRGSELPIKIIHWRQILSRGKR